MKIVKLNESNNPIKYYISIGRNPGTILLNAVLFRTKGKQLVCRSVDTITNLLKTIDITNGLVDGESLTGIEPYQASELRFAADFDLLEEAKQFILCWAKIQRFYFDIHFNFANNTEESDAAIYENYTIVGIDQNTNEIVSNYIIARDDLYDKPLKRSAGFVKKSREINEDVNPNIYYVLCYNPGRASKNHDIITAMKLTASKSYGAGILTNTIKECDSYYDFMEVEKEIDNTGTFGPRDPMITLGVGHSFTQLGPNNSLNTPLMFADKSFIIDIFRVFAKAFKVAYSEDVAKNKLSGYYIGVWDASLNQFVDTYNFTDADLGNIFTSPTKPAEPVTYARSAGFIKKGSREITEALDTPKWGIGYQNPAFDGRYVSSVFFTTDTGDKIELKDLDDFKQLENKLKSTDLAQFGKSLTELDNTESPYVSECMWFDTLDDAKYAMRVWADLWRYWARQHPRYSKSNHDDMIKAILLSVFELCEVNFNPEQVLQTYTLSKYDLINPAECARSKGFIKKGSRELTEAKNNIYYVLCVDQDRSDAWSVVDGLILRAPKPNQDENVAKQVVTTKCTTYNEFMQLERAVDNGIITPINTISIDYSNELVRKGQDLTTALIFDNKEFAIDVFRALAKAYLTIYSFSKDVKQNLLDDFFISEWDNNLKMGVNAYKLTEADIDGGPRTFARSTGFVKKGSSRESN